MPSCLVLFPYSAAIPVYGCLNLKHHSSTMPSSILDENMLNTDRPHTLSLSLLSVYTYLQINLVDSDEAVGQACAEGMKVSSGESESGCSVGVSLAPGEKCERCWNQCTSVGTHDDHTTLCSRCHGVVQDLGIAPPPVVVESAAAVTAA